MSDKSNKKPVWVDEIAHGILKDYCTVSRQQMVEVATRLILDNIAALESGSLPAVTVPTPAEPAPVAEPVAAAAPAPEQRKKPTRAPERRPDNESGTVRYLGGVWLV